MAENKKQVPKELLDIWDEYEAAAKGRDAAVKGFFKFQVRNAVYLGKIAEQKNREFWNGIRAIYPEFKRKDVAFNATTGEVWLKTGDEP